MTRYFDVEAANEALVEVSPLLATLADQRAELIRLRDRTLATSATSGGGPADDQDREEGRLLRLRMQGVIDQMTAAVARIDSLGITLRDIERGLIDFPALAPAPRRPVWLCWELGESEVAFWHELETGFGSRRPLIELT